MATIGTRRANNMTARRKDAKPSRLGLMPTHFNEWLRLADELFDWAKLPTSLHIEQFPLSKGYSPMRFFKWYKHNEYFAEALEYAIQEICLRRELLVHEKKFDRAIYFKYLPIYDPRIRELMLETARNMGSAVALPEVTPL